MDVTLLHLPHEIFYYLGKYIDLTTFGSLFLLCKEASARLGADLRLQMLACENTPRKVLHSKSKMPIRTLFTECLSLMALKSNDIEIMKLALPNMTYRSILQKIKPMRDKLGVAPPVKRQRFLSEVFKHDADKVLRYIIEICIKELENDKSSDIKHIIGVLSLLGEFAFSCIPPESRSNSKSLRYVLSVFKKFETEVLISIIFVSSINDSYWGISEVECFDLFKQLLLCQQNFPEYAYDLDRGIPAHKFGNKIDKKIPPKGPMKAPKSYEPIKRPKTAQEIFGESEPMHPPMSAPKPFSFDASLELMPEPMSFGDYSGPMHAPIPAQPMSFDEDMYEPMPAPDASLPEEYMHVPMPAPRAFMTETDPDVEFHSALVTPLEFAAYRGSQKVFDMLLECGATFNPKLPYLAIVLFRFTCEEEEFINQLTELGADINQHLPCYIDYYNRHIIRYFAGEPQLDNVIMLEILLSRGAKANIFDYEREELKDPKKWSRDLKLLALKAQLTDYKPFQPAQLIFTSDSSSLVFKSSRWSHYLKLYANGAFEFNNGERLGTWEQVDGKLVCTAKKKRITQYRGGSGGSYTFEGKLKAEETITYIIFKIFSGEVAIVEDKPEYATFDQKFVNMLWHEEVTDTMYYRGG